MTFRRPPAVASWLLTHLSDPDVGLIGDLIEEYQRRPSRAWYWRQVAIAIVAGFARGVASQKLETVQAMLTGFAAFIVLSNVVISPALQLLATIVQQRMPMPPWPWNSMFTWAGLILTFGAAVCIGRLIANRHASRRATMVIANVLFLLAWSVPELYRLAGNAVANGRFTAYFVNTLVYFLVVCAGISIGGLWRRPGVAHPDAAVSRSGLP